MEQSINILQATHNILSLLSQIKPACLQDYFLLYFKRMQPLISENMCLLTNTLKKTLKTSPHY